jgi:hypothetical protein
MAHRLGRLLAELHIGVVYGGASVGCMGALADAALTAGGEVVGVIPHGLAARELAHHRLTELHIVESMHERKAMMAELSDGFIALPGGLGTLEELSEIATWAMLGIHGKPLGLLDVDGYWQPLLGVLDHMVREGFLRVEHRALVISDPDPTRLIERCRSWVPPARPKWLDESQT